MVITYLFQNEHIIFFKILLHFKLIRQVLFMIGFLSLKLRFCYLFFSPASNNATLKVAVRFVGSYAYVDLQHRIRVYRNTKKVGGLMPPTKKHCPKIELYFLSLFTFLTSRMLSPQHTCFPDPQDSFSTGLQINQSDLP